MPAAAKKKKVGLDLTNGPILRCIILFASPIVLASLIQQLYSVVDLVIIGHFMGSEGTVGVSTGGEISDLLTPVATSFSTAIQIYIAQLVGAKQKDRLKTAIGTGLTFLTLISLVFMIVTLLFTPQILRLINCPEEGFIQARNYMLITAVGLPFIFGYNAVCGVLRGMGESRAPMIFIIIAAVSNIALDILLVAVIPLQAAGTAIATVIAQVASFAASFIYMYRHREHFDFEMKLSFFKMNRPDLKIICGLGIPQAIRSSLVRISMLWVNASINSYGLTVSATNSVGNKLQKFLEVFTSSLSQASAAMVGQNLGARKHDRAKQTVLTTFYLCFAINAVLAVLTILLPKQIFGIFTKDAQVLTLSVTYTHIMFFYYLWSAFTSSFQSMIIGSGYAALNFVIGILDGIACRIGLSILLAYGLGWGARGFFTASAWSRAIPGFICLAYFLSGKWKERKLLTE